MAENELWIDRFEAISKMLLGFGGRDPERAWQQLASGVANKLVRVCFRGNVVAPGSVINPERELRHPSWRFCATDIDRLLMARNAPTVDTNTAEAAGAAGSEHKGGRPRKYNWDAFAAEMVRRAQHPDGLPDRATLSREMAEWCLIAWGVEPADSVLRAKIAALYPES